MKINFIKFLEKPTHIAPLAVFRIVFGAILFLSIIRFMANGWVYDLYVEPTLFFPYYGFEWIKPLSKPFMYVLFSLLAASFLFQCLGLFYRISSTFSFLAFTYIELIDKTNYLNHYYFVSIICFLLIFLPANRYFSLDVKKNPELEQTHVPNYIILLIQIQLALVYFFAGLAKLNYDWIVEAMPLKIWLPSKSNLPIIGGLLTQDWIAYLFSWFGALYDLTIPFLLFYARSRWIAYVFVIVFHLLTYWLFQIGMFPFIMIGATLIFFSKDFHLKVISIIRKTFSIKEPSIIVTVSSTPKKNSLIIGFYTVFLFIQLFLPFRYLAYPGNLYWTEQGYRFSWRVMLMEKAGYAIFHIYDPANKRTWEINNYDFLTSNQEKMMSTQPDMILQLAHYLDAHFKENGILNSKITAEVYVTLNGRASQLLIDPTIDLTKITDSFAHKKWVLELDENKRYE